MKQRGKLAKRFLMLVLAAVLAIGSVGVSGVLAADTAQNGYVTEDGQKVFYKNGKKLTGVAKVNGYYYYFIKGIKQTDLKKNIKGHWYYFKKKSGKMAVNEIVTVTTNSGTKKKVGYNKKGQAVTGKKKIGNSYYYFKEKTYAMRTGWIKIGNDRFYFSPKTGKMVSGAVKKINGTKYEFSKSGKLKLGNPDMNKRAQQYSSRTKYLILINRGLRKVSIYKGTKDAWTCIKYWPCVVGAPATQTPVGVFSTTGVKGLYFTSGGANWWWFTNIVGSYHFHSQGYAQGETSAPYTCVAPNMSQAVSHGCIRLYVDNAKWIYNNIGAGTTVAIYN